MNNGIADGRVALCPVYGKAIVVSGVARTSRDIQDADETAELLDHLALSGYPLKPHWGAPVRY